MRGLSANFKGLVIGVGLAGVQCALAQAPLVDLAVAHTDRSQVRVDAASLSMAGTFQALIVNKGRGHAAGNVVATVFSDSDGNGRLDVRDQVVGSTNLSLNLRPGRSARVSIVVSGTVPSAKAPLYLWIDSKSQLNDANKANNVKAVPPPATTLADVSVAPPVLKWQWSASSAAPGYDQVSMIPIVAPLDDTNLDGRYTVADDPRVLVVGHSGGSAPVGVLHVLDGKTGAELRANTINLVEGSVTPAVADIDGDGVPEIVTVLYQGGLIAFNADLSVKRRFNGQLTRAINPTGGPTIADIDGDGQPEVLFANQVYNANGTLKWQAPTNFVGGHCCLYQIFQQPVVTSLSAGGPQVVLLGASAYAADGALLWRNDTVGDGFVAVGDLDKDGRPEIVVVQMYGYKVYALNADGSIKWGPFQLDGIPGTPGSGAPVITDLNGDGYPDIGVPSGDGSGRYPDKRNYMTAIDRNGNLMWKVNAVQETGPIATTAYDFNLNGTYDVITGTFDDLNIHSGLTGQLLHQSPVPNYTLTESPSVADADGDGSADILIGSNNNGVASPLDARGLKMYSSDTTLGQWAGTRRIWNQHAYSITNINDDMSVPRNPVPSWLASNTFRVNVPVKPSTGACEPDNHQHQTGVGHTTHGNGNGNGHCKDKRNR